MQPRTPIPPAAPHPGGAAQPSAVEALAAAARAGDSEAAAVLIERLRPAVRALTRRYFLPGGDRDDLAQEAMVGILGAIREYDAARGTPFRAFALMCAERRVFSAVRQATRRKHAPLNDALLLDASRHDTSATATRDPGEQVVSATEAARLTACALEILTPLEEAVLRCRLAGCTYQQTADALGSGEKTIDNALQRIRRKLARALAEQGAEASRPARRSSPVSAPPREAARRRARTAAP